MGLWKYNIIKVKLIPDIEGYSGVYGETEIKRYWGSSLVEVSKGDRRGWGGEGASTPPSLADVVPQGYVP